MRTAADVLLYFVVQLPLLALWVVTGAVDRWVGQFYRSVSRLRRRITGASLIQPHDAELGAAEIIAAEADTKPETPGR